MPICKEKGRQLFCLLINVNNAHMHHAMEKHVCHFEKMTKATEGKRLLFLLADVDNAMKNVRHNSIAKITKVITLLRATLLLLLSIQIDQCVQCYKR